MSDTRVEDTNAHSVHEEGYSKKDIEKKVDTVHLWAIWWHIQIILTDSILQLSPLSTLESSFEALNVKKFDGDHTS